MRKLKKILLFILTVALILHLILKVKIKNIDIIGNSLVSDSQILTTIFESESDRSSIVFFIKTKFLVKNLGIWFLGMQS